MISRAEYEEGMSVLAGELGKAAVRISTLERLVLALACIGVDQAADRTAYTEKLRGIALQAFENDADPRANPLRERAELLLGKIEGWAART